jgi:hypothetical protein
MFIKVLILSAVFLAAAFAGLGIRMLMKPNGRFPETHISKNGNMRKRGITCARYTDTGCNSSEGFDCCASCNEL